MPKQLLWSQSIAGTLVNYVRCLISPTHHIFFCYLQYHLTVDTKSVPQVKGKLHLLDKWHARFMAKKWSEFWKSALRVLCLCGPTVICHMLHSCSLLLSSSSVYVEESFIRHLPDCLCCLVAVAFDWFLPASLRSGCLPALLCLFF